MNAAVIICLRKNPYTEGQAKEKALHSPEPGLGAYRCYVCSSRHQPAASRGTLDMQRGGACFEKEVKMSNKVKKLRSGKVIMSSRFAVELSQALTEMQQEVATSKQEYAAMRDTCSNLVTLVWEQRAELDELRTIVGRLIIGR